MVPLRLRPHLDRLERAGAGPVLEVPVLPPEPGERRPQRALTLLSTPPSQLTSEQTSEVQDLLTSYDASLTTPFDPFAVARSRPVAFQYYVVMKYLDNLIAWGDSLFTQMTIETVNEATLCYVLAANLLGPRPQPVPQVGTISAKCYNDLKNGARPAGRRPGGSRGAVPVQHHHRAPAVAGPAGRLFGTGQSLYFCVPANAQLLGYWDTVEDRLSKIRNCENIEGQVQLMPLFDPPIDPGMLVAAAAAGLDIGSVVSGLNQPTSPVRAPLLIQKALELCSEVRSLGAGLLAAIEKGDAESLARAAPEQRGRASATDPEHPLPALAAGPGGDRGAPAQPGFSARALHVLPPRTRA